MEWCRTLFDASTVQLKDWIRDVRDAVVPVAVAAPARRARPGRMALREIRAHQTEKGFTCRIQWPARRCVMCGSCRACDLKYCSRCKRVWYCSEGCRLAHQPRHRLYCSANPLLLYSHTATVPTSEAEWTTLESRFHTENPLELVHPDCIYLQPPNSEAPYDTLAGFAVRAGRTELFELLVEAGAGDSSAAADHINSELCNGLSALKGGADGIARRRECLWIWLHAKRKLVSPKRLVLFAQDMDPRPWVCLWTEFAGRSVGDVFNSFSMQYPFSGTEFDGGGEGQRFFQSVRHLVRHGVPVDARSGTEAVELQADRTYFELRDAEHLTLAEVSLIASLPLVPDLILLCVTFLF